MTDKALIELGYRYGAEARELAQGALDALKTEDLEACRKALLELLASVDRYHRTLFASGPLLEGNAQANALERQGALYDTLASNADELLRLEEERQRQMYDAGEQLEPGHEKSPLRKRQHRGQ